MDKVYDHLSAEAKHYQRWEDKGYFKPVKRSEKGEPFTIILPPPNANGSLHFGHAMFVIEDILIRYHRMKGDEALWLPGTDHAGTETQFVYEKKLQEEGKSRFDFTREELYQRIKEYVEENQGGIESQLKRLGFSLDWSRKKFTLDPEIVIIVNETFKKLYEDGLAYRDYRLVNYCTRDGTSFSDLEVLHEERQDFLYYIKYGPLVLATTRPETKFGDTAVAVNPNDARYTQYVGKELDIETVLGPAKITVVADEMVDPEFGTGVVKITPAHDFNDFEVAKRRDLPLKQVIGFDGKMNHHAGKFEGLYVKQARKAVVEEMQAKGLIEKIDENYIHRVGLCYKCKTVLEPLPLEQWYVKIKQLADKAQEALASDIKVYPGNFTPVLEAWYKNLRDWNISRQNVWGIRIPVWYKVEPGNADKFVVTYIKNGEQASSSLAHALEENGGDFEEIINGLQRVAAPIDAKIFFEDPKDGGTYLPETDTFDTWFSSAQWPYVTLQTTEPGDFEKFYPTSVMETGRDILFFWVSRMIMMGLYKEGKIPFKHVILHGIVNDPLGKKMSKSKGNVVNPLEVADQYGADAVRFALVYGTGLGNDQAMSYPKLEAARKFTNKLWNMARFLEIKRSDLGKEVDLISLGELSEYAAHAEDKKWVKKTEDLSAEVTDYLNNYQFNLAAERLYDFIWHEFADKYIEEVKLRVDENSLSVIQSIFASLLKLLHPFMPFITEEIYLKMPGAGESIMIEAWPQK